MVLALGFAAINTGNNLLYLIVAMMLSLIMVSGILSEAVLRKIRLEQHLPWPLFARAPFEARLTLLNRKRFLPSYCLKVKVLAESAPSPHLVGGGPAPIPILPASQQAGWQEAFFLKVSAGQRRSCAVTATFSQRGGKRFLGYEVSTFHPLGLFKKTLFVPGQGEVVVFPPLVDITLALGEAWELFGQLPSFQPGPGGEFHSLRDYTPGEDQRHIHWKTSARKARLMIREWEKEGLNRLTLVVDNTLPEGVSSNYFDRLERALSLASSLAVYFAEQGYYFRLITGTSQSSWGQGQNHLWHVLEMLALLSPGEREAESLRRLSQAGATSDGPAIWFCPGGLKHSPAEGLVFGPQQLDLPLSWAEKPTGRPWEHV